MSTGQLSKLFDDLLDRQMKSGQPEDHEYLSGAIRDDLLPLLRQGVAGDRDSEAAADPLRNSESSLPPLTAATFAGLQQQIGVALPSPSAPSSLRAMLGSFFASTEGLVRQLQASLAAAELRAAQLELEVSSLVKQQAEAKSEALNAEVRIALHSADLVNVQQRLAAALAGEEAAVAEKNSLAVTLRELEMQRLSQGQQLDALSQQVGKLSQEKKLRDDAIASAAAQAAATADRIARDRRTLSEQSDELQHAKREIAEHEATVRLQRSQISALTSRCTSTEQQLSLALTRQQQAEDARRAVEGEAAEQRAARANLQFRVDDLEHDRLSHSVRVEQLKSQVQRGEAKHLSVIREMESLRSQIQGLQDLRTLERRAYTVGTAPRALARRPDQNFGDAADAQQLPGHEKEASVAELLFRDAQKQIVELQAVLADALLQMEELGKRLELSEGRCGEVEHRCASALVDLESSTSKAQQAADRSQTLAARIVELEAKDTQNTTALRLAESRSVQAAADALAADERASRIQCEFDAAQRRSALLDHSSAVTSRHLRQARDELLDVQALHRTVTAQLEIMSAKVNHSEKECRDAVQAAQLASARAIDLSAQALHHELMSKELRLKVSASDERTSVVLLRAVEAEMAAVTCNRRIGQLEANTALLTRRLADAVHRQETLQCVARDAEQLAESTTRHYFDLRREHIKAGEELRRSEARRQEAEAAGELARLQTDSLIAASTVMQARAVEECRIRRVLQAKVAAFTNDADALTAPMAAEFLQKIQTALLELRALSSTAASPRVVNPPGTSEDQECTPSKRADEASGSVELLIHRSAATSRRSNLFDLLASLVGIFGSAREEEDDSRGRESKGAPSEERRNDVLGYAHVNLLEHVCRVELEASEVQCRLELALSAASTADRALAHLDRGLRLADAVVDSCLTFVHGYVAQRVVPTRSHPTIFGFFSHLIESYAAFADSFSVMVDAGERLLERVAGLNQAALQALLTEDKSLCRAVAELGTNNNEAPRSTSSSSSADDVNRRNGSVSSTSGGDERILLLIINHLMAPMADAIRKASSLNNRSLGMKRMAAGDDGRRLTGSSLLESIGQSLSDAAGGSLPAPADTEMAGFTREMIRSVSDRVRRLWSADIYDIDLASGRLQSEPTVMDSNGTKEKVDLSLKLAAVADAALHRASAVERVNEGLRHVNSDLLQRWETVCDGHMFSSSSVLGHMRRYISDVLMDPLLHSFWVAKEGLLVLSQRGVLLELVMTAERAAAIAAHSSHEYRPDLSSAPWQSEPFLSASGSRGGQIVENSSISYSVGAHHGFNHSRASLGVRAFLKARTRTCEAASQTTPPPEALSALCQTDPAVDEAVLARLRARDDDFERRHHEHQESVDRQRLEAAQAALFSAIQESAIYHRRGLLEAKRKQQEEHFHGEMRRIEESNALRIRTILEQSSSAMSQTTARLRAALERSTSLEVELQQYRRQARRYQSHRDDSEDSGATFAAASSRTCGDDGLLARTSRADAGTQTEQDPPPQVDNSGAVVEDRDIGFHHSLRGESGRSRTATSWGLEHRGKGLAPSADASGQRHVALVCLEASTQTNPGAPIPAPTVSSSASSTAGAEQPLPISATPIRDDHHTHLSKQLRSSTADATVASPLLPRELGAASLTAATGTPKPTGSSSLTAGLVLSGAKRLDGLQSGGSADGEQGQVVGAAQQQRMLVALSRSERQARYQLQVVQQELLTVTKAAAVLASRCRQLLRGSVVLEGTVMTMCDPLVRKHPVGSVCAAFTQTNNPQPGEKGAGGWSAASVLSGMGFVLGGSREH